MTEIGGCRGGLHVEAYILLTFFKFETAADRILKKHIIIINNFYT